MPANDPHTHLSRRQRQIVDVLYTLGEADVSTVQQNMPNPPGYSAVRAMLVRLEEAGHVRHREQGAKYIYSAIIEKDSATVSALRRLINTFFSGSRIGAATAFFDNHAHEMSDQELHKLEKLIKKTRQERKQES